MRYNISISSIEAGISQHLWLREGEIWLAVNDNFRCLANIQSIPRQSSDLRLLSILQVFWSVWSFFWRLWYLMPPLFKIFAQKWLCYHIIYRHNLLKYVRLAGTHPKSCGHFFTDILRSFRPSENLSTWPLFSRSFKLVYTVDLDTPMSLKRLATALFGWVWFVDAKILTSRRTAALTVLNIFAYQSPENCSTQFIFTGHKRNDNTYVWSKFYQIAFKIEKVTDHKLLSNSIVITRYIPSFKLISW